jgi:two-component system phosphate regulon response regulator PhoB
MIMTKTKTGEPAAARLPGTVEMMPASGTYRVHCTFNQEEIAEHLRHHQADYVVVGAVLPARSGAELCKLLGRRGRMQYPVVLIKAEGEQAAAPRFASPEAIADRLLPELTEALDSVKGPDLEIHPGRHEVRVMGEAVDLTATEFRILQMFTEQPGWVFSRDAIIEHVRGKGYSCTPRSVDVLIVGLRRKLGALGKNIQTIRGVGYRYRD